MTAPREGVVTAGELARAKRRALSIFDDWKRVTGCIDSLDGTSWLGELESCIEDAVEIGVQAAFHVYKALDSEDV